VNTVSKLPQNCGLFRF